MAFVYGQSSANPEIIIARNLKAYREDVADQARKARAELMRGVWAHKDASELEGMRVRLEALAIKVSEIDRMIAKGETV